MMTDGKNVHSSQISPVMSGYKVTIGHAYSQLHMSDCSTTIKKHTQTHTKNSTHTHQLQLYNAVQLLRL